MRFDELNRDNYLLFAIKFYNNPQALTKEDFDDDLKRIKYIKRLLKRYKNTNILKTQLILNHLIVLFNVFDDAATGQGLLNYFLRALNSGAITEEEVLVTGLTLDEIRGGRLSKFLKIERSNY